MILEDAELQVLLRQEFFKQAFEYLISDMNAHLLHLFKTLKAQLQRAVTDELKAENIWAHWTQVWSSEDLTILSALQKINTQLFSDKDAISLTEWCMTKGQRSH